MFLGKVDHTNLINDVNTFHLELYECAEVNFCFSGSNIASFNRMFCIIETDGKSCISQQSAGKRFIFKSGGIYFASSSDELFMHFAEGTHFFSFHFDCLSGVGEELFFQAGLLIEELGNEEWIASIYELLHGTQNHAAVFHLKAKLLEKIAHYLGMCESDKPKDLLRNRTLHNFFRNEVNAQTTIEEVASIVGLPVDTYSRKFSKTHHVTLKSYIDHMIAARAERLLRDPEKSIKEVANILNFNNEYYFSRFFKRETLTTPSSFRKNLQICSPFVLFR